MNESSRSPVPEVSVVVPTHNRRDLLVLTLRSVRRQRDVELEVIVVDDGSTDDTSGVVAGLGDPRIRPIRHDVPLGVSAARNRGIAEARGEWIAFLDDDDLWAPDKLALQLQAVKETGKRWAYTGAVNVDELNRVRGGSPPLPPSRFVELLPHWCPMPGGCSNALVRADVLSRIGGFDTGLSIIADWDLWLRFARSGEPACVARPLIGYRLHAANMTLNTQRMLAELGEMERRYGPTVDRGSFMRYMARLSLRSRKRASALRLFAHAAMCGPIGASAQLPADIHLVIREYLVAVRGRLGLPASRNMLRRQEQAAVADPNRSWKAEAEHWLAELLVEGSRVDRSGE
jgi:glycosyltransferase involved in cell wall biosynthesis